MCGLAVMKAEGRKTLTMQSTVAYATLSPHHHHTTRILTWYSFHLFRRLSLVPTLNKNVIIVCRHHCSVVLSPLALGVKASGEVNRERGFLPLYTPTKKTEDHRQRNAFFFPHHHPQKHVPISQSHGCILRNFIQLQYTWYTFKTKLLNPHSKMLQLFPPYFYLLSCIYRIFVHSSMSTINCWRMIFHFISTKIYIFPVLSYTKNIWDIFFLAKNKTACKRNSTITPY